MKDQEKALKTEKMTSVIKESMEIWAYWPLLTFKEGAVYTLLRNDIYHILPMIFIIDMISKYCVYMMKKIL